MASLFNEVMQSLHDPDKYEFLGGDVKKILPNIVDYPVYDISNVVPLYGEIDNKLKLKRPPEKQQWIEWRVDEGWGRFTYLMLLLSISRETILFSDDFADVEGIREAGLECDEFYTSVIFKRYDGVGSDPYSIMFRSVKEEYTLGEIVQEDNWKMYCFQLESRMLKSYLHIGSGISEDGEEHNIDDGRHRSDYGFVWRKTKDDPDTAKSPVNLLMNVVFTAFSLLHCKNIKEVDIIPDEALQSARRRKGKLPLYGYKILKLNVPIEEEYRVYGIDDELGTNRAHMVRGHFKNLQHERYLNKGLYWWPSHWRGNPELGIVEKDYKIAVDQRKWKKYGTV